MWYVQWNQALWIIKSSYIMSGIWISNPTTKQHRWKTRCDSIDALPVDFWQAVCSSLQKNEVHFRCYVYKPFKLVDTVVIADQYILNALKDILSNFLTSSLSACVVYKSGPVTRLRDRKAWDEFVGGAPSSWVLTAAGRDQGQWLTLCGCQGTTRPQGVRPEPLQQTTACLLSLTHTHKHMNTHSRCYVLRHGGSVVGVDASKQEGPGNDTSQRNLHFLPVSMWVSPGAPISPAIKAR